MVKTNCVFELILATDFMTFSLTQKRKFYFNVDKEASASPLDPDGGLPSLDQLLCIPILETDRRSYAICGCHLK